MTFDLHRGTEALGEARGILWDHAPCWFDGKSDEMPGTAGMMGTKEGLKRDFGLLGRG